MPSVLPCSDVYNPGPLCLLIRYDSASSLINFVLWGLNMTNRPAVVVVGSRHGLGNSDRILQKEADTFSVQAAVQQPLTVPKQQCVCV